MKETTIEKIAYIIQQAKENNQPKPIFFLGAGASKTGDIPLASDIVKDILDKHCYDPSILNIKEEDKTYPKLMECLQPYERDALLKGYIDKAKINVTHIYLAQLLKNDFADYVLTVNFDNLMLRALALFNEFPATYDMAILKDLTTTTFKEKSVVFLHGQHHGLWLLNTKDEMAKVKKTVPRIFDSIKHQRPWIFIGYSGDDPIFEHIKNIGRFDNGLYWVTYKDHDPNSKVKSFIEQTNINASVIKGYDADSFMLKLNNKLGLKQPTIINQPFSSLKEMIKNIVDIDDDDNFKGVKERLEISKNNIDQVIQLFESNNIKDLDVEKLLELQKSSELNKIKKEIINLIINQDYSNKSIAPLEQKVKKINKDKTITLLAEYYLEWGNNLGDLAEKKQGKQADKLYQQAFEKFQKAINIKPDDHDAYCNWGINLGSFAKTKQNKQAEDLYKQSFKKFQKAIDIEPDDHETFYNWGNSLILFARTKTGNQKQELLKQALNICKKGVESGGDSYNLACVYALMKDKKNALKYLDKSLSDDEITSDFVEKDDDWLLYHQDEDFVQLLKLYKK